MKLKLLLGVILIPLNLHAMNESTDEIDYIQISLPEKKLDEPMPEMVILDENFDRLSKAVHNAETDVIRKDALEAVRFFIDSAPGAVCSVDLINVIECYCPVHQGTIYFDLYRKIAQFSGHSGIFHIAKHLWYYGNLDDRNIARPLVRKVAQSLVDQNVWWAAQLLMHDNLFGSCVVENENIRDILQDREIAKETYRLMARDIHHEYACQAAKQLLDRSTEDKVWARDAFREMVIDQDNEHAIEAAYTLRERSYYLDEQGVDELGRTKEQHEEDLSLIETICRELVQKTAHPHAYGAAQFLWGDYGHREDDTIVDSIYGALEYMSIVQSPEDVSTRGIKNARITLRLIAQNALHKDAYLAARALKQGNTKDRQIARLAILMIAGDINHEDAYGAASLLYDRDYYLYNCEPRVFSHEICLSDQKVGLDVLKEMAQNIQHPNAWQAAAKLSDWNAIRAIAADINHKDVFFAAERIWKSYNVDRQLARPAMRYIASNPKNWRQGEAINYLCKSDDLEDQKIGSKLLKSYFRKASK
jgi:hypothetical protein